MIVMQRTKFMSTFRLDAKLQLKFNFIQMNSSKFLVVLKSRDLQLACQRVCLLTLQCVRWARKFDEVPPNGGRIVNIGRNVRQMAVYAATPFD